MDDRFNRIREVRKRLKEIQAEKPLLEAELDELLELTAPRKSPRKSVLPHAEGLFAGAARRRNP